MVKSYENKNTFQNAYRGSLVADAVAMPMHGYYDRGALRAEYGEITGYLAWKYHEHRTWTDLFSENFPLLHCRLGRGEFVYKNPGHRMSRPCERSHVANGDGLAEAFHGVAGGDEFVADVSLVVDIDEGLHDCGVIEFLARIHFAAARDAGGVDVADEAGAVFVNAGNEIAVHDLDVIDVEEQLHVG